MIQVADNFNYRGKKPNFDRDSFDTLYDMKNYSENSLDDGHISYCKETGKHYKFNSNNQSDSTTGNGTIIGNKTKVINLNVDRIVLSGTWFDSGTTSNRPTNVLVGFQYFDTTINKPIFWDGSKWIDATGATV